MEFILPGLKILTYSGIGLVVIGSLVLFGLFWGNRSYLNYILGFIVLVGMGIFFLTLKSSGAIRFTESAVELKAVLTKTQVIDRSSIKRVWIVDDLVSSEWRPVKKRSGTTAGEIRTGWFTLENGNRAFLVLQGNRAIGLEAEGRGYIFLLGINDFESLVAALISQLGPALFR